MLTIQRLRECLTYDPITGIFTWNIARGKSCVGKIAGCIQHGYVIIRIDGVNYKAHRLAWLYVYGKLPDDILDHINCIRSDNRLCNLRDSTYKKNSLNRIIHKTKKPYCSKLAENKWRSYYYINNKQVWVGIYDNEYDAAEASMMAMELEKQKSRSD
jgi:hypothetical protein